MDDQDFSREIPLKLQTVVEAMEMANFDNQTFYNTITGALYYRFNGDTCSDDSDEPDLECEGWIALPDSSGIEDLRWMRNFARHQPSPLGDTLLDAAYARHPYRKFKDTAFSLNLLQAWFDYRDDRLRETALAWFDQHGLTPPGTTPTA